MQDGIGLQSTREGRCLCQPNRHARREEGSVEWQDMRGFWPLGCGRYASHIRVYVARRFRCNNIPERLGIKTKQAEALDRTRERRHMKRAHVQESGFGKCDV